MTSRRTRPVNAAGGNPSRFTRRLAVAGLALLGSGVSTYLALYQYRVVNRVWDPVFGEGSKKVLDSPVSRALPVPDAALGAAAYAAEAVLELTGRRDRWRTQPKLVLLVGAASTAFALTGTALTVSQPMLSGTFCTLCLTSTAISLLVAAGVSGEVRAALGG